MHIKSNSNLLLFRYSDYRNYDFITEHREIIDRYGAVWMMKIGRKSNPAKVQAVIEDGGFLILRAPKSKQGKYYIAHFESVMDEVPKETHLMPDYYARLKADALSDISSAQYFYIRSIEPLPSHLVSDIVLQKTSEYVEDVIVKTRTAVMFVTNTHDFQL